MLNMCRYVETNIRNVIGEREVKCTGEVQNNDQWMIL